MGALLMGAYCGFPDFTSIITAGSILGLSMICNLLPLLFFYKNPSFRFKDHLMGPYINLFEEPPSLKNTIYLIGPFLTMVMGVYLFYLCPSLYPYSALPFLWAVLRLFPIEPFEGWSVLRGILRLFLGFWERRSSYLFSGVFSITFSLMALLTFNNRSYWIGLVGIAVAFNCFQQFKRHIKGGTADENPEILTLFQEAIELFRQNKNNQAQAKLWQIIQSPLEGLINDQARVIYAQNLLEHAEAQKALEIITPCLKRSPQGMISILHKIAYQCHQFNMVRDLASKAWQEDKNSSVAIINAISSARLHQATPSCEKFIEESLGWLKAAQRMGYRPWDILEGNDFDSLKKDPRFINFKQNLPSLKLSPKPQEP